MIHTSAPDFFQHYYPARVISSLLAMRDRFASLFLAGGAVRDLLIGQQPTDLDLTVCDGAIGAAQFFASQIKGKFVLLDEEEDVARVVWKHYCIDFSSFREKSKSIEDDLSLRDFTINAMAFPIRFGSKNLIDFAELIDPCNGLADLKMGIIKQTHAGAFRKDPLRIIRAYRFLAIIGQKIEKETETAIYRDRNLLDKVSPERLSYELHKIMESSKAYKCFSLMTNSGVLPILFPEMAAGQNLTQPGSHHLDVFEHNLAALGELEKIIEKEGPQFQDLDAHVYEYLKDPVRKKWLKWASFFHDLGKSTAHKIRDGKITFYGHDNIGSLLFIGIARRLKWSNLDTAHIAQFIKHHMWLFHLTNAQKRTGIKPRACLKIYKALGPELTGLYLLSLADSLAAQGQDKPAGMEKSLGNLYGLIRVVINENINPVLLTDPVLNGKDIITNFKLEPGPIFGEILSSLEKEQVTHGKMTKEMALQWVEKYLKIH